MRFVHDETSNRWQADRNKQRKLRMHMHWWHYRCFTASAYYCFLNGAFQNRFILPSLNVLSICCHRATFKTGLIIIVARFKSSTPYYARCQSFLVPHFWYSYIQYSTIDCVVSGISTLMTLDSEGIQPRTRIEREKGSTYIEMRVPFPITWN